MTALLPILPGQVDLWSRPRPEPVVLVVPGWDVVVREPDATFPNQRWVVLTRGTSRIEVMRYWDSPRNPGFPMKVARTWSIEAGARTFELHRTSIFDGVAREVDLCWFTGRGHDVSYGVRVVFERCDEEVIADALGRIDVRW